jgi:acetoin utilization protein AcuC
VLGGGGYNPWSVARCWTGIWAVLNDIPVPDTLPEPAEAVLRALSWSRSAGRNPPERWFTMLADPPHRGPVRAEIRALSRRLQARLEAPEIVLAEAV